MLLVPAFFGITGYLGSPLILKLLNTPADILPDASMYIRYMCLGLVFVSLYNYLASMLRALGDSRSPLYFLIFSLEKKFNGEGRVLIRPSGTEPLVRVMIEGKDQEVISEEAKKLAALITEIML